MTISEAGERAFTLLELFFVIIIIGVLTVVSFPSLKRSFYELQLDDSSSQFQLFVVYLQQRSSSEGKTIYLNIDQDNKQYWAQFKETNSRIRTYPIPSAIKFETEQKQITFYPDGKIDEFSIKLSDPQGQTITLSTEGVLNGVKVKNQD